MKVFLRPPKPDRLMTRVTWALMQYAPRDVQIVLSPEDADLIVSHVTGPSVAPRRPEVIIQYRLHNTGPYLEWLKRWKSAKLVWSYFDLYRIMQDDSFLFYHAPLGVDESFTVRRFESRDIGLMTSGSISSSSEKAIEEAVLAAWMLNIPQVHLGPTYVEGMRTTNPLNSIQGVSDIQLAEYYHRCKWVSSLRHREGFELTAVEGLCGGARPIVFDRPDMHQWYDGHAVFIPECSGVQLVRYLLDVLDVEPEPVLPDEREWAVRRFAWRPIVEGFWRDVLRSQMESYCDTGMDVHGGGAS